MAALIQAGGPHITSLSLSFTNLDGVEVVSAIQNHCVNLNNLHVVADECNGLAHLLQSLPDQLLTLTLPTRLGKSEGMQSEAVAKDFASLNSTILRSSRSG